jgi:hypothetical protein
MLRCTRRLLDVLGPRRITSPAPQPDPEDFYANLVVIERRKCLLLTHAAMLFSVFVPDVRAPELRATKHLVSQLITEALGAEDLPVDTFDDLSREELVVAKTADRRVLGCMNDLAFLCEETAARTGGLRHLDVAALNASMHRLIHTTSGYTPPIDALRARSRGSKAFR